MRVLFDQATPVPLRPYLEGHAVSTAFQQGWDKLKNGELVEAAEQTGFDLFLPTDKNMRYQQKLADRTIAIVVLGQQQWPHLRPHIHSGAKAAPRRGVKFGRKVKPTPEQINDARTPIEKAKAASMSPTS
jgi:hypothetical protein